MCINERRFELLTDASPDIITELSVDGTILFISAAVWRIAAKRPRDLIGRNFCSLLCKGEHGGFLGFLSQIGRGDTTVRLTVRLEDSAREPQWLELSGRALTEAGGTVKGIVCVGREVSGRMAVEHRLREECRQAEKANAQKSEFVRNVSHEIRTPLNAIMGFSELIRDETFGEVGDHHYSEYAGIIYESSNLLKMLINNLLDLSKIEAGKYQLHLEDVKLKDVASVCICQIKPQATRKNITIKNGIDDNEFILHADKMALMQILINLLSNAVKFTPDGGHIELKARRKNDRVWIHVSDTGIGIRRQDVNRIKCAFEQVAGGTQSRCEGTGLGLALVKSLAKLHHGDLAIRSEPGVGTVCSVVLPGPVFGRSAARVRIGHQDSETRLTAGAANSGEQRVGARSAM